MEKIPNNREHILSQDLESFKMQIVEAILNNGFEKNLEIINNYLKKGHIWVEEDVSNKIQCATRQAMLIVSTANFYEAAGDAEEADECIYQAIQIAEQEGLPDLAEYLKQKLT